MKKSGIAKIIVFFILSIIAFTYESKVVSIPSKALGKSYKATVVTPDEYKNSSKNYPVVYLLHGWSGNYTDWVDQTSVEELTDKYGIIIVTPDGDYDKWYVDSKINKNSKFSTFIGKEVVEYIDKNYHTIALRISSNTN